MGVKAFVPFTQARRERLYAASLQNMLGDAEALVQIEWPDGTITYEPAGWHPETSAWLTESGKRFYRKGNGRGTYQLRGVPIVPVAAENAAVVTTEGAQIANRELEDEYVDADGRELQVEETDEHGDPVTVSYADDAPGEAAADGGVLRVGEDVELHYDLAAPDDADGEVLDRSDAGLIDPFPVSRQEADQAVEYAKASAADAAGGLKTLLIGIAIGFGLIALFIVLMWLLGQIGGEGGGVSIAATVGGGLV